MAQAPSYPAEVEVDRSELARRPTPQALPVTPGKVAMWLFLATEVMFFTGLIGTYIVLRAGSPATSYSNLFPPATNLDRLMDSQGIDIHSVGEDPEQIAALVRAAVSADLAEPTIEAIEHSGHAMVPGMKPAAARKLAAQLEAAGAEVELEELETYQWPLPYHNLINPLSIDLTAVNTFILICSSVTMVLALSGIQQGSKRKLTLFLLATLLIGGTFLGVQVYEYYQLMLGHHYPIGISHTGHFRPSVSLFASCFFTMTGFHGAHVFGGLVMISCILLQSLRGAYTHDHHSPVELVGLYWHFVDLVWILLFTVVYLV